MGVILVEYKVIAITETDTDDRDYRETHYFRVLEDLRVEDVLEKATNLNKERLEDYGEKYDLFNPTDCLYRALDEITGLKGYEELELEQFVWEA